MKDCWKSIGIAGNIRGSGATHLSVALANYAASGLGEKTAYLELDGRREITYWKEANEKGYFTDLKIHYYPDFKKEQIPILLNREYGKIIMDFGDTYLRFREEILRCDRKIFLLNLNPWQMFAAEKMVSTVQNKEWGGIQPIYVSINSQEAVKREVEKKYKIQIKVLPFISNPRCICQEQFPFMDFILGSPAAETKKRKSLIPIRKKK